MTSSGKRRNGRVPIIGGIFLHRGAPALAARVVMGSGSVLSGMIAWCEVNSEGMHRAAVAGVYMHSAIGDMLYKRMGAHIIASDVVKGMPAFFGGLRR